MSIILIYTFLSSIDTMIKTDTLITNTLTSTLESDLGTMIINNDDDDEDEIDGGTMQCL